MGISDKESLVLRYFHSWHNHDFPTMRSCLSDDVRFDMGHAPSFKSVDDYTAYCRRTPSWRDVTLLETIVHEDRAAILYEGVSTRNGARMRVGEFLRFGDGKIRSISVASVPLDQGPESLPPPPSSLPLIETRRPGVPPSVPPSGGAPTSI